MRRVYGYNPDGSVNEKEAANVRHIFEKSIEYDNNPPQVLIDRAREEAEADNLDLTEDELRDKARMMVTAYIAEELNAMAKKEG